MQDFLFLFFGCRNQAPEPSPEEMQQTMEKWFTWIGRMRAAGIYKGGHPLDDGGRTIRGTSKVVTDGPFAESKEIVGGYMLVQVKDVDEAVSWAKQCPALEDPRGSRVEVRPIHHIEGL